MSKKSIFPSVWTFRTAALHLSRYLLLNDRNMKSETFSPTPLIFLMTISLNVHNHAVRSSVKTLVARRKKRQMISRIKKYRNPSGSSRGCSSKKTIWVINKTSKRTCSSKYAHLLSIPQHKLNLQRYKRSRSNCMRESNRRRSPCSTSLCARVHWKGSKGGRTFWPNSTNDASPINSSSRTHQNILPTQSW